jgi:hypothetical protein
MQNKPILFRCSKLGALMTEPKAKTETLSETCKTYLREVYINRKYGRYKDFTSDAIKKGLETEEAALTLFSIQKMRQFNKNEDWLMNDYICGTPDSYEGETITSATKIIDIKSAWDLFTFHDSKHEKVNKNYYWQMQGYMWLTGATKSTLVYCLINTPDTLIQDQKRRLGWNMGLIDNEASPEYLDACAKIDRNSLFDDIPNSERIFEIEIERNDADIQLLSERIKACRSYMAENYPLLNQQVTK